MDVLSDVLRSVRATGTVYFCDQLEPPWEKQYPGEAAASFHQIRRGGCVLQVGELTAHLGPGDFVFLGPGRAHVISSEPPLSEAPSHNKNTLLLCGYCTFDSTLGAPTSPLSALFPDVVIIREQELHSLGWLQAILDQLSHEYLSGKPGAEIVVTRMTEVLIVELVRMSFGQKKEAPLMRALADRYVSVALQHLHQSPEKSWSLELLASTVGLSRAAFAKRFRSLVGQPMFDYLTHIRMQQACQLLAQTDLPLYEVAGRVGYESDLAFARTFKKRMGQSPTQYRKQAV